MLPPVDLQTVYRLDAPILGNINQQLWLSLCPVVCAKLLIFIDYIYINQHYKINTPGDSKSPAARRAGSSPAPGTSQKPSVLTNWWLFAL
jgi:hypothetical protein